jgi:hypothetical protein
MSRNTFEVRTVRDPCAVKARNVVIDAMGLTGRKARERDR